MTDPSARRRRRRPTSDTSGHLPSNARPLVALGGFAVIVLAAAAVATAPGDGFGRAGGSPNPTPATPRATEGPSEDDLNLVAPAPSASLDLSLLPIATGWPFREPTASGVPAVAIRATRIRLDRLGIDLPIVEGDGIDAPLGRAAHYPGSAWPGGGSNVYLYAHARPGMFLTLWQAMVGDEVVLQLVDGTARTYIVTAVLPKVPWDALQYVEPTPTEQLTLQTSTSYGPTAPRFIVIAVRKT